MRRPLPSRDRRGTRHGGRRWIARTTAAVAVGAVVVTGGVALAPAERAEASWQGTTDMWLSSLNSAIGTAGPLFGVETGPFNIAATLVGPLISSIFGTGEGPGIQDVLDKLQELDDIERKIDVMQSELVDIEKSIGNLDRDVLMGACSIKEDGLPQIVSKLKGSQSAYEDVLEAMEDLKASSDPRPEELKSHVESFLQVTLGSAGHTGIDTSAMAQEIRLAHERMISTPGHIGVIESCGKAYFNDWRLRTTSAEALTASGAADRGVWLDDRPYYEPLQNIVQYWQTAESHAMFLLQQAALMQAAKQYTISDKRVLDPADAGTVCNLANAHNAGNAKAVCKTALKYSNEFYGGVVAEWRQVGVPLSDDQVVMSLGTDVTGLRNAGQTIESAVWARDPSTFPVPWAKGSWDSAPAPTTAAGLPGFAPATSAEWNQLEYSYRASHPTVVPAVQTPVQLFKGGVAPWAASGVKPFAPLDLLATMRDSRARGSDAAVFDTSGVDWVWIPKETATRDLTAWRERHKAHDLGVVSGLTFPSSRVIQGSHYQNELLADNGLTVRCMVAPVDGVLCGSETIASWFMARQSTDWTPRFKKFSVTPSSSALGSFSAGASHSVNCVYYETPSSDTEYACEWWFDLGVNELPPWLAPYEQKGGGSYAPAPGDHTLWPVSSLKTAADCANTIWGVPTRCGASVDAWLKANIPNPSLSGPVPVAAPVIAETTPGSATCPAPVWAEVAGEPGVAIRSGDITWSGWSADGTDGTGSAGGSAVTPKEGALALNDFAAKVWGADAPSRPASFSLRCSIDARFVDLATITTVTSAVATATFVDGTYRIGSAGAEVPPGPEPVPVPSSTPAPTPAPDAGAPGGGSASLAATGSGTAVWWAGAMAVVLAGALLALNERRRRKSHGVHPNRP